MPFTTPAADVYHARAERVPFPTEGTRRERVTAYLAAEARAFERFVAAAPEQWLAVFHPIWPDLERAGERPASPVRSTARPATQKDPESRSDALARETAG